MWHDHPCLFVNKADVPAILAKAKRHEWAQAELDRIRKSADTWLTRDLEFPPSTGRHSKTYICPGCKEQLNTLSATRHQCPKCDKVYTGLPYDAKLYGGRHDGLSRAASDLGLAALFFDQPAYAEKALRILLGYAERYNSYPLLDTDGGQRASGARVHDQTLNEAIWLIQIAWAYDLVRGAGVGTPEEHKKVESLLRDAVKIIQRYRAGKSNWQTWHNAGMLAAALTMKDEQLVNEVLNDPECGFYFQVKNSILTDGAWWEGSWSYHAYSVSALLWTTEAAHHSGINLYTPEIRKCFAAPLQATMPNGKTPPTHDGMEGGISVPQFEIPAARYGDPVFQNVLAKGKRGGLYALLYGVDDPRPHPTSLKSAVMEGLGAVILRNGDQYLYLDYGPHGGGHGHRDKLSVVYYTQGQVFGVDPGRGWPYNLPIHQEWYKLTLSHNTVVVDEQPQPECEGVLESTNFIGKHHSVTATADNCYPGVRMKRTVILGKDWMLDVYDVKSDTEHVYDWVWHGRGEFSSLLSVQQFELKGSHKSYSYLSNVRKGDGASDWKGDWTLPGGKVYGLFKGSTDRTVLLCDAPDNPKTNTLHSVILRDKAKETRFVALFSTKPMKWEDLPKEARKIVE